MRLVEDHEDEDACALGLAESEDGQDGTTLLLMCSTHPPDEQDVAPGTDTCCLVGEEQSTAHGAVLAVVLDGDALTVRLTRATADALGLEDELRLVLDVPPAQVELLLAGATRVLSYGDTGSGRGSRSTERRRAPAECHGSPRVATVHADTVAQPQDKTGGRGRNRALCTNSSSGSVTRSVGGPSPCRGAR